MADRIGAALLGIVGGVIGGAEESSSIAREPSTDGAATVEPEAGPDIQAAPAIDDEPVFTARPAASEPEE